MASSMLAAVREAIAGTAELALENEGQPGASAPNSQENGMSRDNPPAGGVTTGMSQAEHDAAVKAARTEGEATGAKAATDRFVAIVGADGVKGNAQRLAAAMDLAAKSPAMSADDVVAFVSANVAAGDAAAADPKAYEAGRQAAAGLAQPVQPARKKASIDTAGIYASRRKLSQEG